MYQAVSRTCPVLWEAILPAMGMWLVVLKEAPERWPVKAKGAQGGCLAEWGVCLEEWAA